VGQVFTYFLDGLAKWESRWGSAAWEVITGIAGSIVGACLGILSGTFSRTALAFGDVGEVSDVEVVARVRYTSSAISEVLGLVVRGSGTSPADANGYGVSVSPSDKKISINKLINGVNYSLGNFSKSVLSTNLWFWIRFRVVGTTIQAKAWRDIDPEPTTWGLTVEDSSIAGPGWVGVVSSYSNAYKYWDTFGVGLNGDPAPTEPVNIAVPRRKWRNAPFGFIG
jgi:hypothetical protein